VRWSPDAWLENDFWAPEELRTCAVGRFAECTLDSLRRTNFDTYAAMGIWFYPTKMLKSGFFAKASAFAILVIASASIYFYFSRKSPAAKSPQELAIESKGLPEFDAENNKTYKISPQNRKMVEEMTPIVSLIGDGKDAAKNREVITGLSNIIRKYPEYSDAHFMRATLSLVVGNGNYQQVLSDIDKAIQFHSSTEFETERRRCAVEHAREKHELSERHACRLVNQWRGTQRYLPIQRTDEDALTRAIITLASEYGRYG
jgi:hypothetical protein